MPMTRSIKNGGGSWFNIGSPGQKEVGRNPVHELTGQKVPGFRFDGRGRSFQTASMEGTKVGGISFSGYGTPGYKGAAFNGTAQRRAGGSRKAASAMIAKIPLPLSRHIAATFAMRAAA